MTNAPTRHMTPDEVLHALRHFSQLNADEPFTLSNGNLIAAETTVAGFDRIRDSDGELRVALNNFFGVDIPADEWDAVLTPREDRTVGELCRFLAERVRLTPVEPFRVMDRPCPAGAIFLTLKARLAARGVNVRRLAPSTPIARYARWYPTYCDLLQEAALIAPGRLPPSELAVGSLALGLGKLLGCGSFLIGLPLVAFGLTRAVGEVVLGVGAAGMAILFTCGWVLGLARGWNRLPGVRTFRDLCKTLAGEPIARPQRA